MRNEASPAMSLGTGPLRWILLATLAATLAFQSDRSTADPAVLLEQARLTPSDGLLDGFGRAVAVDGTVAVVGRNIMSIFPGGGPDDPNAAAYVFERNASGQWVQTAKLTASPVSSADLFGQAVAVEGRVIAVGAVFANKTYVFEDTGAGWVQTAVLAHFGSGYSVAIQGGVIAISSMDDHNGMILYRRGPSGWAKFANYMAGEPMADIDYLGPQVDISANRAIHGSWGSDFTEPATPSTAYIYTAGPGGDWTTPSVISIDDGAPQPTGFSSQSKISGDVALISGRLYEPNTSGVWRQVGTTLTGQQDLDGNLALAKDALASLPTLYRRTAAGAWPNVAELASSNGPLLTSLNIRNSRVVAGSYGSAAYIFDVPTDLDRPPLLQDDFQDGNANGWSPTTDSTFTVTSNVSTLVYRQSNVTGNATAVLSASNSPDQSIQADIRPLSFNGADRWFGLAVRYTDPDNYYYVTARSTNVIQLKRLSGDAVFTLASAALPVSTGRNYRLRLEAIGSRLRVFVDDRLLLTANDPWLLGGRAALMMYKASADYDNVVFSSNPAATVTRDDFEEDISAAARWRMVSGMIWRRTPVGSANLLQQSSAAAGTSAVMYGSASGNQIVQADARATSFDGADRWFGLLARYIDDSNYHYITVRSSNTIMLRKLVGGVVQTLDSAPLPVTTGTWYRLRLEIIGQSVRAYVNGALVLEAVDPSITPARSTFGVATYKATADIDNFVVLQP